MKTLFAPRVLRAALAVCLVFLITGVVAACPNCKEALAVNGEGGSDLVRGYFYSILFMMGMPFTILGAFSFSMYRAVKKAQADAPVDGVDPSVPRDDAARFGSDEHR
jgi:hypothetical protein